MHLLLLPLALSAPPKDDRDDQGPDVVDVVETSIDVADQLAGDHPTGTPGEVVAPANEGAARGLSRDAAARQAAQEAIDALSGGAATSAREGVVEGAAAAAHVPAGVADDVVRGGLVVDDLARGGLTVARGAEVAVVGGAAAAKTGLLAKAIKGLATLLGLGAAGAAAAGAKKE
jgi:hypothetical protein